MGLTPDGVRKYRVAHGIQAAPTSDRVLPSVLIAADTVPQASVREDRPSVREESPSITVDLGAGLPGVEAVEPEQPGAVEPEATPGVVEAPVVEHAVVEVQPVELGERRLTAYSLVAVRGDERETFVVLAATISQALARAEAALSRGPGELWEVVEMRAAGKGLE